MVCLAIYETNLILVEGCDELELVQKTAQNVCVQQSLGRCFGGSWVAMFNFKTVYA